MVRKKRILQSADPLTISTLAKRFGLARSTLLHYDRIGLLRPRLHSRAGYRLYDASACEQLSRIVELRAAGLPLDVIRSILATRTPLGEALEQQVTTINRQMEQLREQQRVVLSMLEKQPVAARGSTVNKASWTRMFRAIGLSDADMRNWHARFEHSMPHAHRAFLESLGLSALEIRRIRAWSARTETTSKV